MYGMERRVRLKLIFFCGPDNALLLYLWFISESRVFSIWSSGRPSKWTLASLPNSNRAKTAGRTPNASRISTGVLGLCFLNSGYARVRNCLHIKAILAKINHYYEYNSTVEHTYLRGTEASPVWEKWNRSSLRARGNVSLADMASYMIDLLTLRTK